MNEEKDVEFVGEDPECISVDSPKEEFSEAMNPISMDAGESDKSIDTVGVDKNRDQNLLMMILKNIEDLNKNMKSLENKMEESIKSLENKMEDNMMRLKSGLKSIENKMEDNMKSLRDRIEDKSTDSNKNLENQTEDKKMESKIKLVEEKSEVEVGQLNLESEFKQEVIEVKKDSEKEVQKTQSVSCILKDDVVDQIKGVKIGHQKLSKYINRNVDKQLKEEQKRYIEELMREVKVESDIIDVYQKMLRLQSTRFKNLCETYDDWYFRQNLLGEIELRQVYSRDSLSLRQIKPQHRKVLCKINFERKSDNLDRLDGNDSRVMLKFLRVKPFRGEYCEVPIKYFQILGKLFILWKFYGFIGHMVVSNYLHKVINCRWKSALDRLRIDEDYKFFLDPGDGTKGTFNSRSLIPIPTKRVFQNTQK